MFYIVVDPSMNAEQAHLGTGPREQGLGKGPWLLLLPSSSGQQTVIEHQGSKYTPKNLRILTKDTKEHNNTQQQQQQQPRRPAQLGGASLGLSSRPTAKNPVQKRATTPLQACQAFFHRLEQKAS
jgi:hypothetical protein